MCIYTENVCTNGQIERERDNDYKKMEKNVCEVCTNGVIH